MGKGCRLGDFCDRFGFDHVDCRGNDSDHFSCPNRFDRFDDFESLEYLLCGFGFDRFYRLDSLCYLLFGNRPDRSRRDGKGVVDGFFVSRFTEAFGWLRILLFVYGDLFESAMGHCRCMRMFYLCITYFLCRGFRL
ncbi:hypothetical protein D1872_281600 [compost metagenome]